MATMVFAPFMPTRCWIAPGDAHGQVHLRRNGLARASDLTFHRKPAIITDRTGRCQLRAEGVSEFLNQR